MAKISRKKSSNSISTATSTTSDNNSSISSSNKSEVTIVVKKTKRTRKSIPRDAPPKRSSIYRGVTRHRWTGRYEAHLWDKNCWNESQNKKGRQVYLGAYDDEEAAAHAYDLAALKYWGQETVLNFPLPSYEDQIKGMEDVSKEEYIGSLRRKSSGFSRGVSKFRGVARHHHNGRWEARIGRVFGNKYLYLGTYATQEEAATAYDMAAIEYRGVNAVTNFDLSRYIKWLRPNSNLNPKSDLNKSEDEPKPIPTLELDCSNATTSYPWYTVPPQTASPSTALGLLLHSSRFKEMLEKSTMTIVDCPNTPSECSDAPRRSFPDHIQTYFDCHDSSGLVEGEDGFFGDLNSFTPPIFHCELDV